MFFFISVGLILFIDWLNSKTSRNRRSYVKKVTYSKLIYETMYFTGGVFCQNKIQQYPIIDIRYYGTKKWAGKHQEGRIVIYLKSNKNITDIVSTVLHEISHHISMVTRCEEYICYNEILKKFGYEKHPEEIKARNFASQHIQPCIDYLITKGVIE